MFRSRAVLASLLLAAAALSTGVPATAAPADFAVQGIGRQVTVRSNLVQADLKPIPGTAAPNTGVARPGDNLAAICFTNDSRGLPWVLVLNRNGIPGRQYANTVGFISHGDLASTNPFVGCATETTVSPANHFAWLRGDLVQADMKPIAGTDVPNTGLFKQGDKVAVYCHLADNRGFPWKLAVNLYGHAGQQYANTVGFIPLDATSTSGTEPDCGAS